MTDEQINQYKILMKTYIFWGKATKSIIYLMRAKRLGLILENYNSNIIMKVS